MKNNSIGPLEQSSELIDNVLSTNLVKSNQDQMLISKIIWKLINIDLNKSQLYKRYCKSNYVKILFLCLIVSGCAGTIITKDNALKECPYFNVQCETVIDAPEYPILIVGKDVVNTCNNNQWGCLKEKTIYLREQDWMVLGHEQCHRLCGNEHLRAKNKIMGL
jgi:hypothetical protein